MKSQVSIVYKIDISYDIHLDQDKQVKCLEATSVAVSRVSVSVCTAVGGGRVAVSRVSVSVWVGGMVGTELLMQSTLLLVVLLLLGHGIIVCLLLGSDVLLVLLLLSLNDGLV